MDTIAALLLNIVYGFLFFLAFGVMGATMLFFGLATWQRAIRPLLGRLRGNSPS